MQQRVGDAFGEMHEKCRFVTVNAAQSIEQVHEQIKSAVKSVEWRRERGLNCFGLDGHCTSDSFQESFQESAPE